MNLETNNGLHELIPQVSLWAAITDLGTADFTLSGNKVFVIKNENEDAVSLEVMPADGTAYVATKFYPGWNMELVKAVKTNTTLTAGELANLKYGY